MPAREAFFNSATVSTAAFCILRNDKSKRYYCLVHLSNVSNGYSGQKDF